MTDTADPDTRRNTAETAKSMADVRFEVDRLDRALIKLLVERQSFMDAASRIKGTRDKVNDRPRIEDVVEKVLAESRRQGLSPAIAEPVWRVLIDRSVAYEYQAFDARRPGRDKA